MYGYDRSRSLYLGITRLATSNCFVLLYSDGESSLNAQFLNEFEEAALKNEIACCREPRGFGFVQYVDPDDAAEAKYEMDGRVLLGRELTVVFAEENRKRPSEMRSRERIRFDILASFSSSSRPHVI